MREFENQGLGKRRKRPMTKILKRLLAFALKSSSTKACCSRLLVKPFSGQGPQPVFKQTSLEPLQNTSIPIFIHEHFDAKSGNDDSVFEFLSVYVSSL